MNDNERLINGYRTSANVNEMIEMVDVSGKLKNMEMRLTDLVEPKIGNTTKTTYEKVERR